MEPFGIRNHGHSLYPVHAHLEATSTLPQCCSSYSPVWRQVRLFATVLRRMLSEKPLADAWHITLHNDVPSQILQRLLPAEQHCENEFSYGGVTHYTMLLPRSPPLTLCQLSVLRTASERANPDPRRGRLPWWRRQTG